MTFAEAIYEHLMGDGTVMTMVEGRIYPLMIPTEFKDEQKKLTILYGEDNEFDQLAASLKSGLADPASGRIWQTEWTVVSQGDNHIRAHELADAVRNRLHEFRGLMANELWVNSCLQTSRQDDWNPDAGVFMVAAGFQVVYLPQ